MIITIGIELPCSWLYFTYRRLHSRKTFFIGIQHAVRKSDFSLLQSIAVTIQCGNAASVFRSSDLCVYD